MPELWAPGSLREHGVIAGHDRHEAAWHRRPHRGSDLLRVRQERVVGCAVDLGLSLCK